VVALLVVGVLLAGCASARPASQPAPEPAPGKKKLVKGEDPGTTVQVSYKPSDLPKVVPTFTDVKTGPLLFSDSPEYVEGTGTMLYSDVQPGDFRFYLYHVNNNTKDIYFHVVLTNRGDKEATVKVGNNALAGPGDPPGPVGFDLHTRFYAGQPGWTLKIKPGERASLDPRLLKTPVKYAELLAGIWDVATDQPLDVHEIASFSSELPDPRAFKPIERRDEHSGAGVGTFPNYRRKAHVKLDGSRQVYYIASGNDGDTWLQGSDKLRGTTSKLVGNYGVDYEVTMAFTSPTDRTVRVWMSTVARLGGAIKVDGKMIRIPEDFYGNIDAPYDAVLIAKLNLKAGQSTTFTYEFMPPGSFYLPAIIHVEPVEK
jgi:hypothetical protein